MKVLQGIVYSTKMQQSAVVVVETSWKHPLYRKTVRRSKKYLCQNDVHAKDGNLVLIQETKPLSKNKHFTITKVLKAL